MLSAQNGGNKNPCFNFYGFFVIKKIVTPSSNQNLNQTSDNCNVLQSWIQSEFILTLDSTLSVIQSFIRVLNPDPHTIAASFYDQSNKNENGGQDGKFYVLHFQWCRLSQITVGQHKAHVHLIQTKSPYVLVISINDFLYWHMSSRSILSLKTCQCQAIFIPINAKPHFFQHQRTFPFIK